MKTSVKVSSCSVLFLRTPLVLTPGHLFLSLMLCTEMCLLSSRLLKLGE